MAGHVYGRGLAHFGSLNSACRRRIRRANGSLGIDDDEPVWKGGKHLREPLTRRSSFDRGRHAVPFPFPYPIPDEESFLLWLSKWCHPSCIASVSSGV